MTFLCGRHRLRTNDLTLREVGAFLAKMHKKTARFKSTVKRPQTLGATATSLNNIFKQCD